MYGVKVVVGGENWVMVDLGDGDEPYYAIRPAMAADGLEAVFDTEAEAEEAAESLGLPSLCAVVA